MKIQRAEASVSKSSSVPYLPKKDLSEKSQVLPTDSNQTTNTYQPTEPILEVDAYKCRNVYKSIIRHISSYIKEKGINMAKMLMDNGFTESDIKEAFSFIEHLKELDKSKGVAKKQQNSISIMISKKNIYTYILKETLQSLIKDWELGKRGRIMKENVRIYLSVCKEYCKKCNEIITQSN